jgi:hypothetical protein
MHSFFNLPFHQQSSPLICFFPDFILHLFFGMLFIEKIKQKLSMLAIFIKKIKRNIIIFFFYFGAR